ncbi:alpha/beta-hydrolase [Ascodesmis nigricans]|uniref:Alpha/beta-hydrolase n=1 Tax=Ascodesmis nigricans TaxID=341454 RepID=A0A4S2MV84_9PEZI|nr:alpha/beta-hydrolase [Ascodesmis nigricans]
MPSPTPQPFQISIPSETLDWINTRISTSRLPTEFLQPPGKEHDYGVPRSVIDPILEHWKTSYDWRKVEAEINEKLRKFTVDLKSGGEEIRLHFVHHWSEREDAVPLLFCHGWPRSFLEVEPIINQLTTPSSPTTQAFHVIAPSIPGFSFSSPPTKPGFDIMKIGHLYHQLMQDVLGKLAWLALRWMTAEEKKRLERLKWWFTEENGYFDMMGTKPLTISYSLSDSPLGHLAWIRDKLTHLVSPTFHWPAPTVITWTHLYLFSPHVATFSIYRESRLHIQDTLFDAGPISKSVAVGFSSFPWDMGYVPRWWAEGTVAERMAFWREHEEGRHFPSLECPEVLVADVRDFQEVVEEGRKEVKRQG